MQEPERFDLIVIGAGSAGLGASGIAARIGLKVLLIERSDFNIGGDCLNFGCVPSKALLHVAELFARGREARAFGLQVDGKADFRKVMDYVHAAQAHIRAHENAAWLERQGIRVVLGEAAFADERTVEVGARRFTAPKIILATGSSPVVPPIPGLEGVPWYTNETLFYELEALPERLLVIGGGPIGCEMAQAFGRLGSKVTLVEMAERLLPRELPKFSAILAGRLGGEGIQIRTGTRVLRFEGKDRAVLESPDGKPFELGFDAVLLAVGRRVNTEGLGLERAGIRTDERGIVADAFFRTTNPRVFVIGDAFGRHQFSHAAEMHNRQLFFNFFSPLKRRHNARYLSWVTFTDPEVATFGRSEQELQAEGIPYVRLEDSFEDDDRAVTAGYGYGRLVLYLSKPQGLTRKVRILGGSMIAPHAGELIQELLLAMQEKLSIGALFDKVYPYPTAARINQKLIVDYRSQQLTPLLKRLLRWKFRW